jgi:hypothetical protein
MAGKKEFNPILPAGIIFMGLEDFKQLFVDQFPQSARRKALFDKFLQFFEFILNLDIITELWLNGSFVTEKPEPGDIDAVAFVDKDKLKKQRGVEKNPLMNVGDLKKNLSIDIRFAANDDDKSRSYWMALYGSSRDGRKKGFVNLKLEAL